MINDPRAPKEYQGTDLQSAYLDGHHDGREGLAPTPKDFREFCPAERGAYARGRDDGDRARRDGL